MSGPWEDYKETSEQGPWEDYPSPIKSKKIEKLEGFEGGIRAALVSLARNLTFGKSDEIAASILGLSEKEAKEYKKAADHLIKNHPKIDTAADVAAMAVPGGAAIKGAKLAGKGLKKVLWLFESPQRSYRRLLQFQDLPLGSLLQRLLRLL